MVLEGLYLTLNFRGPMAESKPIQLFRVRKYVLFTVFKLHF